MSNAWWGVVGVLAVLAAATVVAAVVVTVRLFRARRLLQDVGVPGNSKVMFWGALLYLLSPVDLVPDPVYLDDIGFLLLALRSLHKAADAAGMARERDERRPAR
ncbi:YkvA family protein [Streptomyces sp. NPDC026206]|uniref:YkvA family protein n=1 Tax=Streptomyces sp. NPDC026206 TaxID=3157089 RepID=UPI0033E534F7